MTKQQMVQAALDEGKSSPIDGVMFVKDRFGVTMTRKHFSSTKNVLTSRAAGNGSAQPARVRPSLANPAATPAVEQTTPEVVAPVPDHLANGKPARTPDVADDPAPSAADLARQLKRLVAEHGADAVTDMLAVFAE